MRKTTTKFNKRGLIAGVVVAGIAIVGAITGAAVNINLNNGKATITYSTETPTPTITLGEEEIQGIETGRGEAGGEVILEKVNGEEIKTVESVESSGPVVDVESQECPEGEECGRGASSLDNIDISSPQAFVNSMLGKCIDVDGHYGSQCWDELAAFWLKYTGRTFTTCGTGAIKGGIADGCWQKNAGNEFTMIWDQSKVVDGMFGIWKTGTWGHGGMTMGVVNNGYVTLLGQNQGGASCPGGGAAANIINLSTRDFIGGFLPKIWEQPEPEPEPEPTPTEDTVKVIVKAGDTLGEILRANGYTGKKLFGDDGLAQKIAEKNGISNRGLILPKQEIIVYKTLFASY